MKQKEIKLYWILWDDELKKNEVRCTFANFFNIFFIRMCVYPVIPCRRNLKIRSVTINWSKSFVQVFLLLQCFNRSVPSVH